LKIRYIKNIFFNYYDIYVAHNYLFLRIQNYIIFFVLFTILALLHIKFIFVHTFEEVIKM